MARVGILIYTQSVETPLGATTLAELTKAGYAVNVVNRSSSSHLSSAMLVDCSQLWLFFNNRGQDSLDDGELKLIAQHNSKSGGVLIVASAAKSDEKAEEPANRVSSRYGVQFSGLIINQPKLNVSVASNLFNRSSEWLGSFLKIFRKA